MRVFTPDQKLLALSWKQPFGVAMLHGKIETRTWPTKYRGWVLICNSRKPYTKSETISITGNLQFARLCEKVNGHTGYFGHAIAIGWLADCRPMTKEDEDACFVKYFSDLYCHVYEDVGAIEPFPWKGSQGWREVTPEVKEKIIING